MVFPPLPRICALEGVGLWGFTMLKAVDVCRPPNCYVIGYPGHVIPFVPTRTSERSSRCPFIPDMCIPTIWWPSPLALLVFEIHDNIGNQVTVVLEVAFSLGTEEERCINLPASLSYILTSYTLLPPQNVATWTVRHCGTPGPRGVFHSAAPSTHCLAAAEPQGSY